MRRTLLYMVFLAAALAQARAQSTPPQVSARFTPDSITIGDHFELEVTVRRDAMQVTAFPEFENAMLGETVEILDQREDTLAREGRNVVMIKRYRLTTFDEGLYDMGRFPVLWIDKNITDTVWSADTLRLRVETFEIDTLTQRIFDIKPTLDTRFRPGEVSGYVGAGLGVLLIAAAVIWWLRRRRAEHGVPEGPPAPPHVAAIAALDVLRAQRLWQNDRHKQYYTRLTDILREYIDGRWGVHAMEMTSDEVLDALRGGGTGDDTLAGLREILGAADLVKFAKMVPGAELNEAVWTRSRSFVEATGHDVAEDGNGGEAAAG